MLVLAPANVLSDAISVPKAANTPTCRSLSKKAIFPLLFLAASSCFLYGSSLNAYYFKGRHPLITTSAVAHKPITLICISLREQKPYKPKEFC